MQLKFSFNLLSAGTAMDSDGSCTKRRQILSPKRKGSKFSFALGSTCATRCKFLGALAKF